MNTTRLNGLLFSIGLATAIGAVTAAGQTVECMATADLWIRETHPTTAYDNDGISVWSTAKGDRRYGLLEFDLSNLAGSTVTSATLRLYSAIHGWSDYSTPIRQTAAVIDGSTGTPLDALTWAAFQSEKDAGKIPLQGLGRYDLPPASTDPTQQNQYVNSLASRSDIELVQAAVDGDGRFCIVLMADETSVYGHSWGDGDGNWSGLAPTLHIELLTAQAYAPNPDDGAIDIPRGGVLTWRPGRAATSHNIYFGTDYNSVTVAENPSVPPGRGSVSFGDEHYTPPVALDGDTTYYWRIDEVSPLGVARGKVWSFATVSGKVTDVAPCDGAYTISRDPVLHWSATLDVVSYNIYLGTDMDQVQSAANPNIFPGRGSLPPDQAHYTPEALLEPATVYFWRVDAIYQWGISVGDVFRFRTTPSDPTTCDGVTWMDLGLASDYNRDCRVDLTDLIEFAQKWLKNVDLQDYAILANEWRRCNDPKEPNCERPWRNLAATCLNTLIEHGTDVYGSLHTPMLMAILDVNTLTSPEVPEMNDDYIRTEGRPDHGRRSPGGSNPWLDQPLIKALYLCSKKTGGSRYADAADAYLSYFMDHCRKSKGLFYWGSHSYWQAFTETYGGDGIHEILILHPDWLNLYRLNPQAVATEVDQIWQLHVCNQITGEHNRHDSASCGLDFAFSGGSFAIAFAFMYHVTGDPAYLDKARLMADRHWSHRNPVTNLPPDAPTTDRYDGTHCMTSVTGPHVSQLLRCYELTGDNHFRDIAIAYIKAYEKYGWDEAAGTYWGMLQLDGTPVDGIRTTSGGYDIWAPRGHVEVWQTTMFSYEFPLTAAQAAVYAYEQSDYGNGRDPELLTVARHWARVIEDNLPPYLGSWWGNDVAAAMPDVRLTGGTYAENYGRAISFFVHVYRATKERHYLDVAEAIATEAVEKLYANGLFKGHPAKSYYQSNDGVGLLLYALLELDNPDEIQDGAF